MPILADSWFWIALENRSDDHHAKASLLWGRILEGEMERLITTDYILDESVTHATRNKTWGSWKRGRAVGETILESDEVEIIYVRQEDVEAAWALFLKYADKDLPFTDCTSMVIMDREGIAQIITIDDHFEKLGRNYQVLDC